MPLRRISHVRVEVRMEQEKFGIEIPSPDGRKASPGDEQITLTVPNTGQLVILRRSISCRAQHARSQRTDIDFRIDPAAYPPIMENSIVKNTTGTGPNEDPVAQQGGHTVYGYDPFGNRIQIGHRFEARTGH